MIFPEIVDTLLSNFGHHLGVMIEVGIGVERITTGIGPALSMYTSEWGGAAAALLRDFAASSRLEGLRIVK